MSIQIGNKNTIFISMFKYTNSVHTEPKSNSINKIKNPISKRLNKTKK
jgi:hypothetical protein